VGRYKFLRPIVGPLYWNRDLSREERRIERQDPKA
jgi:hypothetical protein